MNPRYLLGVLIFAVSVVGLSMGATLPLVALRLHQAGAGSLAIGALSAMPAAGMILGALLVGRLCRHFSGRQLYLACFALCLLASAALLLPEPSLPLLASARLLLGVGMGVLVILGESWVNELCDERKRGQTVALYAACFTGCQLGGPAMISLFGTASAWPVLLVVAANLVALALVTACRRAGRKLPKRRRGASPCSASSASPRRCAWACCSSPSSMRWCCRCSRCMPAGMAGPLAWRR